MTSYESFRMKAAGLMIRREQSNHPRFRASLPSNGERALINICETPLHFSRLSDVERELIKYFDVSKSDQRGSYVQFGIRRTNARAVPEG